MTINLVQLSEKYMRSKLLYLIILIFCWLTVVGYAQWTSVRSDIIPHHLFAVRFPDADFGYVVGWAEFQDNNGTFRQGVIGGTTDGGRNWQAFGLDGKELYNLAAPARDTVVAVGYSGECGCALVVRTYDGFATYAPHEVPQVPARLYSVFAHSPTMWLAAGGDAERTALLKTTDAGNSWRMLAEPGAVFHRILFPEPTVGYAAAGPGNTVDKVYKSLDGGDTWVKTTDFEGELYVADIAFTSRDVGVLAGSRYEGTEVVGIVYRTTDGGATWQQTWSGGDALTAVGFADADAGIGYAVGFNGAAVKTLDGGASWQPVESGTTSHFAGLNFPSPAVGYAVGAFGTIEKFTPAVSSVGSVSGWNESAFVHPNPVRGTATFVAGESGERYHVQFFDQLGRMVLDVQEIGSGERLDCSMLPTGTYSFIARGRREGVAVTGRVAVW